jgi:hypothetical protein
MLRRSPSFIRASQEMPSWGRQPCDLLGGRVDYSDASETYRFSSLGRA